MIIFNILFSVLFLKLAYDAFNEGNDTLGWFNIVVSAFNTAITATILFK